MTVVTPYVMTLGAMRVIRRSSAAMVAKTIAL